MRQSTTSEPARKFVIVTRSGETPARRASVSIRAALAVSSKAATVAPAKTSVASAAHLLEGEKAPGDLRGDGGENVSVDGGASLRSSSDHARSSWPAPDCRTSPGLSSLDLGRSASPTGTSTDSRSCCTGAPAPRHLRRPASSDASDTDTVAAPTTLPCAFSNKMRHSARPHVRTAPSGASFSSFSPKFGKATFDDP